MLTEEKFVKHSIALLMIMFVCVYNISAQCAHSSFLISSMVRGHHKYKDIWVAIEGEVAVAVPKRTFTIHNPFSVAV